jgi:TIR domain-containing protein
MTYDVFISYTRHDAMWAAKVSENLKNRGLRVFLDTRRINAGDEWEETLRDAITESENLLVLWSNVASNSKWVMKEQESFRQMMHLDSKAGILAKRRMLQLSLDATNVEYSEFQTIGEIQRANAYAAGANNVDANIWSNAIERIAVGVNLNANLPPIHQVILASTRERMQTFADDHRPVEDAARWIDLIASLNFPTKHELIRRYGDERSEWRPFGGQKSILTVLNELREELMGRGSSGFLWKPIGEQAWSGVENKRILRDQLSDEPCVVVLDPISLYDATVRERYDWLLGCLQNPKAAIAVLPPYSTSQRDSLRAVLESAAAKMFEPFYQPDRVPVPITASCSLMADDSYEVSRVVASMIRTAFGKEKSAKLRF